MRWEPCASPPPLPAGEVHVWRFDLNADDSTDDRELLSEPELERAARLADPLHARRFVARRALLRRLLSGYTGVEPQALSFTAGSHGKPELAGDARLAGWRFNLSDSDGRCLVAVARGIDVGIDVQRMRPIKDLAALASEALADDELAALLGAPPPQRLTDFYRLWVRKEAFIKASGEGLARPLKRFSVALRPGPGDAVRVAHGDPGQASWTVAWSATGSGFAAALVTGAPPTRVRLLHPGAGRRG